MAPRLPHLSELAAEHVRSLIMSGRLRPGDTVQPGPIGAALGISATPAREALHTLKVEGFLEVVPRTGFQVAPLEADDIRDLFCAVALLAGELAARACARASGQNAVDELEAIHYELIAAARRKDYRLVDEKNKQFHHHIATVAESRKIHWLADLAERYIPHSYDPPIAGWLDATLVDHVQIIDAFRRRDEEGARSAMQEHIVHAGELLARNFEQERR